MSAPTDAEVFGGWAMWLNASGAPWGSGPWNIGSIYYTPEPPTGAVKRAALAAAGCRSIAARRRADAARASSASLCDVWRGTAIGERLARLARDHERSADAMEARAIEIEAWAAEVVA